VVALGLVLGRRPARGSAWIGVERLSVYEVPFMVQRAFSTDSWDAKKGSYAASALDVLRSVGRARSLKRTFRGSAESLI
jgi:hypothetical protein